MRQRVVAGSVIGLALLLLIGIGFARSQGSPSSSSTTVPADSAPSTTETSLDPSTSTTAPASSTAAPPPAATACTNAKHTPGGPDGKGGCWPGPGNTGVPAGTALTNYTGSCTITKAGTVIDAKTVNCGLSIRAANVVIKRSKINGSVSTDENSTGYSLTISDTEIDAGQQQGTGLGAVNFTATRVHIRGGNRSLHCWHDCVVSDSYVHGQYRDNTGKAHESGMRMDQRATFRHNSILCDAPEVPPDAGCSADLTGYGDFGVIQNNTIERNLFMASTSGGYCAYGGSSTSKPYPDANHIVFKDNVFQRGPSGKCGAYGPITSFDVTQPGNVWTNNVWDNGGAVPAAN